MSARPPAGTAALLGIACAVLMLGAACSHAADRVSLARLSADQDAYAGHRVVTTGTVRRFPDAGGPYYVLEDAARHRVEVQPASAVANLVGVAVEVTGTFEVDPGQGRVLRAISVSRAPAG